MKHVDVLVAGGSVAAHAAVVALGTLPRELGGLCRLGPSAEADITIVLWPRGVEALRKLGVKEPEALGQPLRALRYRDANGELLSSVDVEREGARLVAKSQIAAALEKVAMPSSFAAHDEKLTRLARENRGISWKSAKTSGLAKVVVGAAGLRDPVRALAFGPDTHGEDGTAIVGHSPPHGLDGWGTGGVAELVVASSSFVGIFPSLDSTGTSRGVCWWLSLAGGPLVPYSRPPSLIDLQLAVRRVADGFGEPVRSIVLRATELFELPTRSWLHPSIPAGTHRVALLGDSFRAATPELGLGTTWALEDALRLRDCVGEHGLVPGFAEYVRASAATAHESVLGRVLSRSVVTPDAYLTRKFALKHAVLPRAAAHLIAATR